MYVELRHLRTIRAIQQAGGLARAADMLNMTHVMEALGESRWHPPEGMTLPMPPESPNRDFSVPQP